MVLGDDPSTPVDLGRLLNQRNSSAPSVSIVLKGQVDVDYLVMLADTVSFQSIDRQEDRTFVQSISNRVELTNTYLVRPYSGLSLREKSDGHKIFSDALMPATGADFFFVADEASLVNSQIGNVEMPPFLSIAAGAMRVSG